MAVLVLILAVLFTFLGCPTELAVKFKLVDLTHEISDDTIYWPGNPAYNFTILSRGQLGNIDWFESNYIAQGEHGGTHIDAPAHFHEGRWKTHQIPIENLHGPGVIIDVKSKATDNPDYRVTINDLETWEKQNGDIPEKAAVIMNSGWGLKYPNMAAVFQTDTPNDPATFHFPAWHEDTVAWLINKRNVRLVGVDTPSTDYGQSKTFPVHKLLAKEYVIGLENVANLDKLPSKGSFVFAGVIKTKSGSGGPARIFAQIFNAEETSKTEFPTLSLYVVIVITLVSISVYNMIHYLMNSKVQVSH